LTAAHLPADGALLYGKIPSPREPAPGSSHADFSSCGSVEMRSGSNKEFRAGRSDEFGQGKFIVRNQAEMG
jgi:hypothetical protein